MQCNLKECQWCAFGQCCPESEEIYNEAIPDSKECPHYYDLESVTESERKDMTEGIVNIFRELGKTLTDKQIDEVLSMKGKELWDTYYAAYDLYKAHLTNLVLDELLNEIDVHGVEWFKNKYKINNKMR